MLEWLEDWGGMLTSVVQGVLSQKSKILNNACLMWCWLIGIRLFDLRVKLKKN